MLLSKTAKKGGRHMKTLRKSGICRVFSFLAAIMLIVTSSPVPLFAQESASSGAVQSTTKIKYEPIKYFVADKRIKVTAEVTDPEGVKVVRCYFKAKEQADFVFVTMTAEGNTYTAILPAAAKTASSIDYLFLVVNGKNQVVKTQPFSVNIDASQPAPPWQDVAMEGQLKVSTELAQAPAVLEGFSDSIAMDVVESAARFGFTAGIYTTTQMAAVGGATGAAATATSAGTVSTAAGLSTTAFVGIAAGAVAVIAGAVAAGNSSSSSSGSTSCSNSDGTWSGSYSGTDCYSNPDHGTQTMNCSNCSCPVTSYDYAGPIHNGNCTVSGNSMSCTFPGTSSPCKETVTYSGTISGNSVSGTYVGMNCGCNGMSGTWTATKQ